MEVILREDVPNLGATGEIVRVKPGFARNFLLPRGLAVVADRRNVQALEHEKRVAGEKRERDHRAAEGLAQRLATAKLSIRARVGEEGKWSCSAHGVGKSCVTAAAQTSRNIGGVNRPSHSDSPSRTSGGTITPAVSTKRRAFSRVVGRGRPSVMPKTTRVSPKNTSNRQPRKIAVAPPDPEASAARTTCSSLKNGPNGGKAVTANMLRSVDLPVLTVPR